ncbi:acyltransferase [Thalassotalea nanhaiensis]|uniref:Acyltransferase n=1 Tax=Thalassotalea nanhaiensis TaxID=3065648 RepID=A0ABY9THY5_9GAMM|nr:acyltransferase [Colwelliaceae bacterium SQ345]
MSKSLSIYLDLIRFLAALVVFFSHLASQDISGGFLWQFKNYSQSAVMVFFVLSGFVISYVSENHEKGIRSYSLARISRLYSVIIPALVLTVICDYIGIKINPDFYYNASWPYPEGSQVAHYVLSFFLIQNVWDLNLNPGINGPFWSITFEWVYYIFFGVLFYLRSKVKWLVFLLITLLAGPTILALFPIWLLGGVLYRLQDKPLTNIPDWLLAIFSLISLVFLFCLSPTVRDMDFTLSFIERKSILGDYFDAIMFSLHLYLSKYLIVYCKHYLYKYKKLIRWLGSLTFALYLFHRPILQVLAAIYNGDKSEPTYIFSLIFFTFFIVCTIGRLCEKQKSRIKKLLKSKLVKGYL